MIDFRCDIDLLPFCWSANQSSTLFPHPVLAVPTYPSHYTRVRYAYIHIVRACVLCIQCNNGYVVAELNSWIRECAWLLPPLLKMATYLFHPSFVLKLSRSPQIPFFESIKLIKLIVEIKKEKRSKNLSAPSYAKQLNAINIWRNCIQLLNCLKRSEI